MVWKDFCSFFPMALKAFAICLNKFLNKSVMAVRDFMIHLSGKVICSNIFLIDLVTADRLFWMPFFMASNGFTNNVSITDFRRLTIFREMLLKKASIFPKILPIISLSGMEKLNLNLRFLKLNFII